MQIPRRLGSSSTTSGNPEEETEKGHRCLQAEPLPQVSELPEELKTLGKDCNIGGDAKLLYLDCDGGYTTVCISKNLQNCRLKRVNFTVYKLYLNLKKSATTKEHY